ncbi:PREDICTED: gamma-taxilin [Dinoponera quadriceps]|uniref:Gamma-taxilin n=1 Tax=Dinoponera quadriceps TaxID=609295 RepID=A0A6P3YDX6_DINQU|nr:PREDICTED: gamma-taxilin [Dinoponera quadriceps]
MNEKNNDNVKVEGPEMERKENEGECSTRKRTKEDRSKKKDDKRPAEQYSKILSHVSSPEDKLDVMCKKYSQAVDENRRLSLALKHSEKKVELLLREREQLQIERSKSIMTRKRLENLCRELQKQNKIVKNESLQRVKEQEEIRKDLSEKFQGGLAQITTLMNQNIEKNAKMYEENLEINKKFKAVYEQVEQKEQQLLKVHQQMKLDLQVADAKLAKVKMEATAEKEALLKEKQQLLLKMTEYQTQIRELQATEVGLRSEISMYTDKYDEFQNALNRSNKIYGEFNVEMEKMTKKLYALEKETSLWKQRWANSHDALLAMAADKQSRDGEIAMLSKKLTLLQDLCKMFQCERTKLLAQLKTQSAKVPEQPASTPALESQEVVKYMKQMDELPSLENTFEQLQASLSEAMRKSSDGTPGAAEQSDDKRLQTAPVENAAGDSSDASKLNGDTIKPIFYDDFVDYALETQDANEKESSTITVNEEAEGSSGRSAESSKLEDANEDKLTSEEAGEITNDKSDETQKETNDEAEEIGKLNEVPERDPEFSGLEFEVLDIVENIILQAADLTQEEEMDLSRDSANNHLNEQLERQTVDNASSGTAEEDESIEVARENSTVVFKETLSEDCVQNIQQAAIAESNIESAAAGTTSGGESTTEPASMLTASKTSEVSETSDAAAAEDATLLVQGKSEIVAETASEVVQSSSEPADDTVDNRLTKDAPSAEEDISKLATEATCIPAIESVASPKEAPAKTSESDCVEEKLSKPAPIKKRRRK